MLEPLPSNLILQSLIMHIISSYAKPADLMNYTS
ncbi:hypothetical protein T12_1804, partial [Trichinella patagoniensis]